MKNLLCLFVLMLFAQGAFAAAAISTLSWEDPTTRVDGTPLRYEEIKEYQVYYAVDGEPTLDSTVITIAPGTTTEKVSLDLTPREEKYTVSFAILTVDTDGNMSALSETVSKDFSISSTAGPAAPTNLQFTIVCTDGCTIAEVPAQ